MNTSTTPVRLMTVEEFRQLPEPIGDYNYELHGGELVPVARPKLKPSNTAREMREKEQFCLAHGC